MRRSIGFALLIALLPGLALAEEIRIENVGLTLIDKADVPALEAGALGELCVREGDVVQAGQPLAILDDREAQLQLSRARIDAEEAQHRAENDVPLRLAETAMQLAESNLHRAMDSLERFPKSVSDAELEQLRLAVQKAQLEIDLARREKVSAERLAKAAQNDVALAELKVALRAVSSPLEGIVNEIKRRPGEWLTPGETVVRVVNVNTLRAEGFVAEKQFSSAILHRPVRMVVNLPEGRTEEFPGRITFVSSEANPVNGSVRISAEIENRDLRLRPGQSGTLLIGDATSPPAEGP